MNQAICETPTCEIEKLSSRRRIEKLIIWLLGLAAFGLLIAVLAKHEGPSSGRPYLYYKGDKYPTTYWGAFGQTPKPSNKGSTKQSGATK